MNAAKILGLAGLLAFSGLGTQVAMAAAKSTLSLSIEASHGKWHISYLESPVSLEIPEADRFKEMDMGSVNGPRSFYFIESGGVTISGYYEQSDRYDGVLEFWKRQLARFYANTLTPSDVVYRKTGQWEAVLYNIRHDKNKVGVCLKAEFSQAGTWIDLFMSKEVTTENAVQSRQMLTGLLERIQVSVSPSATVSTQELESALADLTDRIGKVDDRGYEKAVMLFSRHLWSQPAGAFPFTLEARPWTTDPAAARRFPPFPREAMLDLAFKASIVRDDLHHAKDDQLYRAWLIVIKYYEDYIGTLTRDYPWVRMPAIEELIAKKKAGQLRDFARGVPLYKDRLRPESGAKTSEPPPTPAASRGP